MSGVAPVRNEYPKGQLVRFETTTPFTINDAPYDPSTVRCIYQNPAGVKTTLVYGVDAALKRLSMGSYYVEVVVDTPGEWKYRFESSGDLEAAAEGAIFVPDSAF